MSKRICLGTIATAHGIKGLVKILCYAEDPDLLNGTLFTSETGAETLTVTMKNSLGKYWLAEVDGVTDRDAALGLRSTKLWIDRDALPALEDDGAFYFEDLVGLHAYDEQDSPAGKIIAVENFGAGDLLEIKPPRGESYYLSFTDENVPRIMIDEGRIVIRKPHDV